MAEKNMPNGPPRWVVWWTAAILIALFAYAIRSILPPFVIGAVAAYVLSPLVARIQGRWRIPRGAAIALLYLALLVPLILFVVYFGPRFVEESRQLITQTPFILIRIIEQVVGPGPYDLFGTTTTSREIAGALIEAIRGSLGTPGAALRIVTTVAGVTLNVFLSIIVSIYLIEGDGEGLVLRANVGFVAEAQGEAPDGSLQGPGSCRGAVEAAQIEDEAIARVHVP